MIYRGKVRNGIIELDDAQVLPEGTEVEVITNHPDGRQARADQVVQDPLFRMADLAVDAGVDDLAINVDHYLYGHPKVNADE